MPSKYEDMSISTFLNQLSSAAPAPGGGSVAASVHRLAPLGLPEFHIYDHKLPPETDVRRAAVMGAEIIK